MIQIIVTFDPATKEVQVQGPVQEKVLCCGMLDMAKEAIIRQEPSKIIAPTLQFVLKNGKN